jgi:hypothetical protein
VVWFERGEGTGNFMLSLHFSIPHSHLQGKKGESLLTTTTTNFEDYERGARARSIFDTISTATALPLHPPPTAPPPPPPSPLGLMPLEMLSKVSKREIRYTNMNKRISEQPYRFVSISHEFI